MNTCTHRYARTDDILRLVAVVGVAVLLALSPSLSRGSEIVRIEEDWELVVANPDPATFAPQVTCTISPVGNLDAFYAVFDLNLRNLPSYEAGGVQLQLWNGGTSVESVKSNTGTLLQHANETITWTQRMVLSDGVLSFSVVNGNSQTWGALGSGQSIAVGTDTDLDNLNSYDPATSVANSGVGFSANRVSSLRLVEIRAYSEEKLEAVDTTPRVIYQHE